MYGYGSVTRIAQFYYQQSLFDGKATLKLGRLPMSGDSTGQPIGLTGATAERDDSASGYYLMGQQQVWQDPGATARKLSLFANYIHSDRDVSYVEHSWQAGLFLSSPFASRPNDEIGLAIGGLTVNDRSAERIRQSNSLLPVGATEQPIPHSEYPAELYYGIAVTPAITVRPNVQYVKSPGGVSGNTDVVVVGVKTVVSF